MCAVLVFLPPFDNHKVARQMVLQPGFSRELFPTAGQRDLPEESIRCLWVGEEESGGGPMGFGVELLGQCFNISEQGRY